MTEQSSAQAFKTSVKDANDSIIANIEFFDELAENEKNARAISGAIKNIAEDQIHTVSFIDLGLIPYTHHQEGSNILSLRFRNADKGGNSRTLAKITFAQDRQFSRSQRQQLAESFRNPAISKCKPRNKTTLNPNVIL